MIDKLNQLLDDLHKSTTPESVSKIASFLMNELCINANSKKYRIAECEIYYDDNKMHKDHFLYGHKKQQEKLQWCFHYSGIDLTIGDGIGNRGGVLIRSIQNLDTNEFISGPLRSSNEVLNETHKDLFISTNNFPKLCLEPYEYMDKNVEPESSQRIGLDKEKISKECKDEVPFYSRHYRYALAAYIQDKGKQYQKDTDRNKKRTDSIIRDLK